jgi:hypothetical protein
MGHDTFSSIILGEISFIGTGRLSGKYWCLKRRAFIFVLFVSICLKTFGTILLFAQVMKSHFIKVFFKRHQPRSQVFPGKKNIFRACVRLISG